MTMARRSRSQWWLRPLLLGAALAALAITGPIPVSATEASHADRDDPTITITPPDVKFEVKINALLAVVHLAITNTSKTNLVIIPAVVLDHCGTGATAEPASLTMPPSTSQPQEFTLHFPTGCAGSSGTLMLTTSDGQVITARFSATRDFTDEQLWWPVIAALVAGAAFFIFASRMARSGLKEEVHVASSWSFKDSWVTNVSAFGGVLTTVLAASGLLQSIVPGLSTGRLVGLSLVFAAAVLAAPLIFSAFSKWTYQSPSATAADPQQELVVKGSGWGVVLASTATVAGVTGQLATLWLLTIVAEGSREPKIFIYVCLSLAAALVVGYGLRFVAGATTQPPSGTTVVVPQPHLSGTL
jgi:hypothetical protein